MVVETEYYDKLDVPPNASDLDIKKAYRKLAIRLHPDKNPGDEEANNKFQAIGEAYQVLSDPQLRAAYDKHGKEKAAPSSGFEDPSEFFGMVFGGEAFADWIGEISLMKDLTKSMEMSEKFDKEEEENLRHEKEKKGISHTASTSPSPGPGPGSRPPHQQPHPPAHVSKDQPDQPDEGLAYPDPGPGAADRKSSPQPDKTLYPDAPSPYSERGASPTGPAAPNPYAGKRPSGIPIRPALMDRSEEEARLEAAGVTEGEKELRAKERKKGLTREQRAELEAYEAERRRVREERVATLARKLVDRLSVWTETDRGVDVTFSFREKMRLEVENLKMESFGLEILHAVGHTYASKGGNFVKSQGFLGLGGFLGRVRDKGSLVKDVWGTISTAMDAQGAMEAMAKAEEEGGEAWTDEARAEAERRVTGKILAAAWRGSKFEIQSVLRDVCDRVLGDKRVKMEKRVQRAQALFLMGSVLKEAKRDDDEEREYMVFEQLMADAARKKEDKEDSKKKKDKPSRSKGDSSTASAADETTTTAAAGTGSTESKGAGHGKHFGFGISKHDREKT